MPLPPAVDKRIRSGFEELINRSLALTKALGESGSDSEYNVVSEFEALVTSACAIIGIANPDSFVGDFDEAVRNTFWNDGIVPASNILDGRLKGEYFIYVNELSTSLEDRVVAAISADYMGQAEALLHESISGRFDYVPAAVLCGAVLEDRLRRWCDAQSPPLNTKKSDGNNMTLGPLIEELRRHQKFDKLILRQLQGWTDIRNHAAHGEFEKFERHDVELMLSGVEHFLANRLI